MTKAIRKDSGVGARVLVQDLQNKNAELLAKLNDYEDANDELRDRLSTRTAVITKIHDDLRTASRRAEAAEQALMDQGTVLVGLQEQVARQRKQTDVVRALRDTAWSEYRDMRRLARSLAATSGALVIALVTLLVL